MQGTPDQIAVQLMSLLPAADGVGATYYRQEALLALNAVLPAMSEHQLPITAKSVVELFYNPTDLVKLSRVLPESCVKANLQEYLSRFSVAQGEVDTKRIKNVLGGLTARLALSANL